MAKKTSKKKPSYKFTLELGDKIYTSEGDTILAALIALKRPDKIMNKAVLTLEHEGKKTQQLFFPSRLKRLFYAPTFQDVQAKMLEKVILKPYA